MTDRFDDLAQRLREHGKTKADRDYAKIKAYAYLFSAALPAIETFVMEQWLKESPKA